MAGKKAVQINLDKLKTKDYNKTDIEMSERALELAAGGVGQVSPSPLVGCVIVSKKGDVVGEGTYVYDEVTHAEVLALKEAGSKARGGYGLCFARAARASRANRAMY